MFGRKKISGRYLVERNELASSHPPSFKINSANQQLGVVKRNLKVAPRKVRLLLHMSLIRSKLEYVSANSTKWCCLFSILSYFPVLSYS